MIRPGIHVDATRYILFSKENVIQRCRPSARDLPSQVGIQTRGGGRSRHRDRNQQGVCILEIIIKRETDSVVEHRQVDTDVFILRSLPFQVLISIFLDQSTGSEHILQFHVVHVRLLGYIGIKILVPGITDGSPDLQIIHPAQLFHKLFVVNVPSQADRPCFGKKLIATENGCPVCTQVEIHQVAIVVRVIQVHEKTG